jgi:hypothetical protein
MTSTDSRQGSDDEVDFLQQIFIRQREDGVLEFYLPESSMSLDDYDHRRTAAFDVLRKKTEIPDLLITLVERHKEQTRVRLTAEKPPEKNALRFGVRLDGAAPPRDLAAELARQRAAHQRMMAKEDEEGSLPASEAIALFLRMGLRDLKYAERRGTSKARGPKLIPRSAIAEIAVDLLQSADIWGYSPGKELTHLFRELLNLENTRQGHPRRLDAQEEAVQILASNPDAGVTELADEVGVNKSSVSRWRKQPSFQARVQRAAAAQAAKTNRRKKL